MIDVNKYSNKKELFAFLVKNKAQLVAQKKFEMKRADAVSIPIQCYVGKDGAGKAVADPSVLLKKDSLDARLVINTTRLLDSHQDVHIDGLWKKSLKEQRNLYHLQEHQMQFDKVISDQVKASTVKMPWRELGVDLEGDTEALLFRSRIDKVRNPFMFEQYAKGYVKNHSVGMRYVQLCLCIDSDDCAEEKANWDKYIDQVANRREAEDLGFFWAVTEAKLVEGSAVLMGSNWATPTQSVKSFEPSEYTQSNDSGPASPPVKGLLKSIGNKLKL